MPNPNPKKSVPLYGLMDGGIDEPMPGESIDGWELADFLKGTIKSDLMHGNGGNDTMHGGFGDDTMHGGSGSDSMTGGDGRDLMYGDTGHDTLSGGAGGDTIHGGDGNDMIYGESVSSNINYGSDKLYGGIGDDTLDGGYGFDVMVGGTGNDTYVMSDKEDVVIEEAGGGYDTILLSFDSHCTMAANVEKLVYTDDTWWSNLKITGNDGANVIDLSKAIQMTEVKAGGGADTVIGSFDRDVFFGGEGSDVLKSYGGMDALHGEGGNDTLVAGIGDDEMFGGAGSDTFVFHGNDWIPQTQDRDVVWDFELGVDRIGLSSGGQQMSLWQGDDGLRIGYGETEIVLKGITAADFNQIDFVYI